jgi:meiotically up-regulated gene 157 (Mug157) protein
MSADAPKLLTAGTGFMHESFNKDNPADFSRTGLPGPYPVRELILEVYQKYPSLLEEKSI